MCEVCSLGIDVRVRRLQTKEAECLSMQSCRHKQRVDVAQPHHNNGYSAVPPLLHPAEQTSTALERSQNEHLRLQKMLPEWVNITPRLSPSLVGKAFLLLSTHKIASGAQIWLRAGKTNESANLMLFDCTEGSEPTLAN